MNEPRPKEHREQRATCEVREMPGTGSPVISGYAAVYNRRSSADLGFIEQIDPGAFTKTLQEGDVIATFNHDSSHLLGRTMNGTLRLVSDNVGLRYEIDVNSEDPDAQSVLAKVRRGDVAGSSFTFQTIRDEWNWEATPPERRLLEVGLMEVAPVVTPAYADTTAAASRALELVATRVGKPVDELVAALNSGEIRSLINGGTQVDTTIDEPAVDEPDTEERAGKAISAANMKKIQAAYEQLRDLMDTALTEAPADSEVAAPADIDEPDGDGARGLSVIGAELEMRQRLAALEDAA